MMKRLLSSVIAVFVFTVPFFAYADPDRCVLVVPTVGQEQSQWCWTACSRAIFAYYGMNVAQSSIAYFACQQQNWCEDCSDCYQSEVTCCDTANYLYDTSGSIAHILNEFGSIGSNGSGACLTQNQIASELCVPHCRPFVIRWGWSDGGGHFLVGRGISGDMIYYMDPGPVGQGSQHVALYDYVCGDTLHTWTHTLTLTRDQCPVPFPSLTEEGIITLVLLLTASAVFIMLRRMRIAMAA